MALEFVMSEGADMEMYAVTERLCLTEDGRLVPEGDPAGRWLFAIPGQSIPMDEARRYGLVGSEPESEAEPEVVPEIVAPQSEPEPDVVPEVKRRGRPRKTG